MRVTQKILTDRSMQNLNNILSRVLRTQDILSSGKEIRRPSDDPVRFNQVLSLRTSIEKLDQYTSNVEDGINWLNLVDESLSSVSGVLEKVRTLVLQGANGTLTAEDREMIATEIEAYLEELIGTANTSYAGRHLFSGTQTLTVPFSREGDIITYYGDNNSIILEIENNTTLAIGFPGDDVFFRGFEASSGDMTSVDFNNYNGSSFTINGKIVNIDSATITSLSDLVNLINNDPNLKSEVYALSDGDRLILRSRTAEPLVLADVNGTPLEDWGMIDSGVDILNSREAEGVFKVVEDIIKDLRNNEVSKLSGEDLGNLDEALDNLLAVRSQVGARTLRLENSRNRFEEFSVNFKKLLSLNEDIDVAEVVMQLNEHQNVYQMALAATARVIQPTLLDFL
ncbi:flagellar hook-associated protein FlgL [Candidatus Sordicultor fermentans]|jgi:flagellar hook-associated protein 3 FlgL|uniref:flagellar hook-associated protein FlgL n=1 Tax=Candidatus Sordicultor fermentans TaxID=1953203 RepID=UPI001698838F|nr:flagellar hook-associated protein FlgL [Candidatus Atribacteria bacterium]HPZ39830.1 flagellar hook-associated protein FlgL [Candidatus Atribacteria bacterium]